MIGFDINKSQSQLEELLFTICEKEIRTRYINIEKDVEYILRNKISKPIKGEITVGKLRWRGIKNIVYGENFIFLGIIEKDKLISL